jgi:hypothetical protein
MYMVPSCLLGGGHTALATDFISQWANGSLFALHLFRLTLGLGIRCTLSFFF